MICGMTYYQICWYFLLYSFGGWILEVVYHAVTLGQVINRGFLNGPVCPVYGFGVVSVFAFVNTLQSAGMPTNDFMIFLFGVILATAVELIAGWLLDICFHARWWDYSNKPLNLHGYICLEFSLLWGLAILLVVRVFHKYVQNNAVQNIDTDYGWIVLAILYAMYFADFAVTVAIIRGLNKKLTQLDALRVNMRMVSDKLSEQVGNTTINTAQKVGEGKVQAALARAEFKDAAADYLETRPDLKEAVDTWKENAAELKGASMELRGEMELRRDEKREEMQAKRELRIEELQAKREELQQRYEEMSEALTKHPVFGARRLLRAFPQMKHHANPEMIRLLRERIDGKKKDSK